MVKLSDLRLSKNMKYTALYWSMRFSEVEPDIFIKKFDLYIKHSLHNTWQ